MRRACSGGRELCRRSGPPQAGNTPRGILFSGKVGDSMKRILVTLPVTEEQKRQYSNIAPEAEFIYCRKEEVTAGLAARVTAVIRCV